MANKITVTSAGTVVNASVTSDTAMYYSNKSREWAISDKIVDNEDYSSKYYANISKQNADKSTATFENLTTNYNQYKNELENTKDISVEEIETAKTNAISDITNQETLSVDNVNTAGETQVNLAKEQANIATTQAGIATTKTSEVVESGNSAITAITEQETTSKNNIIAKGAEQIELIQNEGVTQVANVQSTGFYMRDDKLYFINSQGEETEFKLDDIELNNPYSLFDSKYSDHELNNLSWLKSSGQWNAKAVYPDAYDKLLKVYNGTETVEGLSVKISTEEYTDYDFVLNTADETFRLPLKNHTADDGKSVLTLYFYVGETVQNANLIDAGRIGEQLATKTDMLQASGASMPSNRYIDLTLGANGSTYTAPANGWFMFRRDTTRGFVGIEIVGKIFNVTQNNTGTSAATSIFCPAQKGDTCKIIYNGSASGTPTLKFIYAEGSK